MPITMTRGQYDALIAAGLQGDQEATEDLRDAIDSANNITRYRLSIRWQDIGGDRPSVIELGKGWPPETSFLLELERPIERADVDDVLTTQASNPVDPMVTPDPNGQVGWTLLDDYDFVAGAT